MRAFFGGQIKQEYRGNLAAVVSKEGLYRENIPPEDNLFVCCVFVYPIESEEFVHLTGVRDAANSTERVYIGVSHLTGEEIARRVNGRHADITDLRSIDQLVVVPHFLDKYSDTPHRIILEYHSGVSKVVEIK